MKNLTTSIIFPAILIALALVISLFESIIPLPFIAPGVKLGLSNIVILTTLIVFGFKTALLVSCMKSFLLMLVTGSVSSMFYSLAGAFFATFLMAIIYKYASNIFSLIGVSIFGAIGHNFGQITIAYLIINNKYIYTYLPILIITGIFTGFFVGLSSSFVTPYLEKHFKGREI